MIKTYSNKENGTVKVFFVVNEVGNVISVKVGNDIVAVESGFQFHVDYNVALQIDKVELFLDGLTPKLRLKEGETFDEVEESEEEKEIRELEERLKELKS